jgi:predicted chitinase
MASNRSYEQARKDFEALEKYAEVDDEVTLDAERRNLMNNPTKAFAAELFRNAIGLWMAENFEKFSDSGEVKAIRSRYGV